VFVVEQIANPVVPTAATVRRRKAGRSGAKPAGLRGLKKDEDLFDKFLHYSVNTGRF
jgi:hypothetical protein